MTCFLTPLGHTCLQFILTSSVISVSNLSHLICRSPNHDAPPPQADGPYSTFWLRGFALSKPHTNLHCAFQHDCTQNKVAAIAKSCCAAKSFISKYTLTDATLLSFQTRVRFAFLCRAFCNGACFQCFFVFLHDLGSSFFLLLPLIPTPS